MTSAKYVVDRLRQLLIDRSTQWTTPSTRTRRQNIFEAEYLRSNPTAHVRACLKSDLTPTSPDSTVLCSRGRLRVKLAAKVGLKKLSNVFTAKQKH